VTPRPSAPPEAPPGIDVIIVGGGPAGLSAALVLGRCCRTVVLCDDGHPRNGQAPAVHGYLGVPEADAAQLRAIGRKQLAPHATVSVIDISVTKAARLSDGFLATLADGRQVHARKILLATGLLDVTPGIPGLRELWGKLVFPCPHCDGWEFRGRRFGVLGRGRGALAETRALTRFSRDIVLFTSGDFDATGDRDELAALQHWGVQVNSQPVRAVEKLGDGLRLVFDGPAAIERDVLFVTGPQMQQSPLVEQLGCPVTSTGVVDTGVYQSTCVPGVYVAGDAARDVQFAITAAAEGAAAAFAINRELLHEQFGVRPKSSGAP
jgi:thioredoxin reductase